MFKKFVSVDVGCAVYQPGRRGKQPRCVYVHKCPCAEWPARGHEARTLLCSLLTIAS